MLGTRRLRSVLRLPLLTAPVLVACSSSDADRPRYDPISTDDVVLEGDASEARLTTFLHEKARDWAWAGGQFETPEDGATLSASQPSTFTWHADPADFAEGGAPGDVVMTHLLSFRTARGDLQQVFTTLPEYTPSTPDWQQLVHAHEPITLSLTTGSFVGSELPEEGGPFIGQTLTFTIE